MTVSTIGTIGNFCTVNTVAITESPRIVAIAPGGDVILAGTVAVNVDVPVLCRDSSRKDQEGGYREELHFEQKVV